MAQGERLRACFGALSSASSLTVARNREVSSIVPSRPFHSGFADSPCRHTLSNWHSVSVRAFGQVQTDCMMGGAFSKPIADVFLEFYEDENLF